MRLTSVLILLILVSASAVAYIGTCPTQMKMTDDPTASCCDSVGHCRLDVASVTMLNTRIADDTESANRYAVCQLKLSESWREGAMEIIDEYDVIAIYPSHILQHLSRQRPVIVGRVRLPNLNLKLLKSTYLLI